MKTDTLLFQKEEVKKFFGILDKLSGVIPVNTFNYPWKDYQTIYTKGVLTSEIIEIKEL